MRRRKCTGHQCVEDQVLCPEKKEGENCDRNYRYQRGRRLFHRDVDHIGLVSVKDERTVRRKRDGHSYTTLSSKL